MPQLVDQIQINEGLTYATLMTNGGIVTRSTGKSADATIEVLELRSSAARDHGIAVLAPLYVFGTQDGSGAFTPSTTSSAADRHDLRRRSIQPDSGA